MDKIRFGVVDFGSQGADKIAVNVGVSPDLAGGIIEVLATDSNGKETVVGMITLTPTGGFNDYRDQIFKLNRTLRGKQKIHFHFIGNAICNFRGWKFF